MLFLNPGSHECGESIIQTAVDPKSQNLEFVSFKTPDQDHGGGGYFLTGINLIISMFTTDCSKEKQQVWLYM